MRATNQNWWLDWYLYCILEDVFGMMRISTWPVFFKYSSPLTTSSCFSSFSPSIKVSLVPIHIYPPFFHTSCIFQQIFQQIFLRPIPGCIPNTTIPSSQLRQKEVVYRAPNFRCLQSGAGMTEAGQFPQQNRWIYGWTSHSTESHHKIPMSFVVFVVSKRWPKCSPSPPCDIPFVWRNEVFRTQFLWRHLHGRQLKAECLWFGSCRGGSGDSASGWNMVKQHQMGG